MVDQCCQEQYSDVEEHLHALVVDDAHDGSDVTTVLTLRVFTAGSTTSLRHHAMHEQRTADTHNINTIMKNTLA